MTFRLKALLTSGALILSSGAALAASATATTQLNVRSGPSTTYGVVDTLPAGETVNVVGCGGAWCEISMGRDGTGFVVESYLDHRGRGPARETVIVEDEPEIVGLSIGGYYESRPYYIRDGYYYYGGRWYGDRPGRSGWRDRSWRRWEERREVRLDDRRDGRRERMDDRRGRVEDRRDGRRDDWRDGRRDERPGADRDAGRPDRAPDRGEPRGEERQQRVEAARPERPERSEPSPSLRAQPRDSGDRVGLDRSGAGGRGGESRGERPDR